MTARQSDAPPSAERQPPEAPSASGDDARDRELVAQVLGGDRQAFEELVQRHQTRVFHLARSLLKNRDDAADIAQEAFVRAYGNLHRYRADGSFTAWIAKIANNLAIDFLRRQKVQATTDLDENLAEAGESNPGFLAAHMPADPQAASLRHELGDQLEAALGRLPEKHRSILLLREIDGLSYQELSEALEIPVGTVMSRLFHARAKMQEMLRDYLQASPEPPDSKSFVKNRE